ncbi:MAG: DinB family protein [Vicinamibacteria bacterium]
MSILSRKTGEIVQEISDARNRLLEAVFGLSAEQTDFQPQPGAWSIGEVLHHLALTDEATAKLMSVMLNRAESEGLPEDPSPDDSVLGSIKALVEGADEEKAPAPDRVTPRSYVPAAEALSRLETSRGRMLQSVEALSALDGSRLTYRHPFFGELDYYQWLLITGWHERRHTGQIGRIKTTPGFPHGA